MSVGRSALAIVVVVALGTVIHIRRIGVTATTAATVRARFHVFGRSELSSTDFHYHTGNLYM